MKVTLQVNGREMTFSEKELIAIVEKHLSSETIRKTSTAEVPQKPTEDEWFEVKPQAIDYELFKKKRRDKRQEATRQLILEAFAEIKKEPEKYGKNFKTMMPKKTWRSKTVSELEELARNLGDHNADWVEQVLEWAQRIANGESWEAICNDADTANWYRLVVWKYGYKRLIGGSVDNLDSDSASDVNNGTFIFNDILRHVVPLVVFYE